MELILQDTKSTLTVSESVFNYRFNEALIHQVIVAYAAGSRQGTRSQKSRADVAGSSKKPWRQKGTGRARSGSKKSTIWRSGGVTFAARPQKHNQKVNRKMYRNALKGIFSELIRQDRLITVEKFSISAPKTKLLIQKLKGMNLEHVLVIINKKDQNLFLAARNVHKVNVKNVVNINPIDLVTFKKVIITRDSIKKIEEISL